MTDVVDVFARQAEWVAQHGRLGDRLMASRISPQPHYYLLVWERSVSGRETEDARIPIRSEAWAKALFAALVVSGLTSMKVYVTEHPYLQVFDPIEVKATITLDGAPPILRSIVGEQRDHVSLYGREIGQQSGLEQAMDLASALWTVTAEVRRSEQMTKDKQIAARLGLANVEPLAGAAFYKEYGRLNDDKTPFPTLARACEVLLGYLGGEMMDLVKSIAEESLKIRLPFRKYDRGKAHSYELVFREAVDAMRKAFVVIPMLKTAALTGEKPPAESVAELKKLASGTLLKAMERRQATERGDGFINPSYMDMERQDLGVLVGNFINVIVDDIFLGRAGGSFARFLQLENSIADGVYYVTDRVIGEKSESNQAARAAKSVAVANP
jgi:CRISPR type I-D-associated protein Csc3/Cas10d